MSRQYDIAKEVFATVNVEAGATYYVAVRELSGATSLTNDVTPDRWHQTIVTAPFLLVMLKDTYPYLGPVEAIKYCCSRCTAAEGKDIIDPQLAHNESLPPVKAVDGLRPRRPLPGMDSRWVSMGLEGWAIRAIAMAPRHPGTLYVVPDGTHFFRTTDDGRVWSNADGNINRLLWVNGITADPVDPQTAYVAAYNGFLKTTDGGATWTTLSSGLERAVYSSPRGGHKTMTPEEIEDLAVDPTNRQNLFVITPMGIFKSTDGGANWRAANSGLPRRDRHQSPDKSAALAIDVSNPQTLYAGFPAGGIFKTVNGGENWIAMHNGLPDKIVSVNLLTIAPSQSQTIYASLGSGGLYKTTDGGGTWRINWKPADLGLANSVSALAVDPANPLVAYVGICGFLNTKTGGIFKTSDGGATWGRAGSGVMDAGVSAIVIDPTNPQTVYVAVGTAGLFKSAPSTN